MYSVCHHVRSLHNVQLWKQCPAKHNFGSLMKIRSFSEQTSQSTPPPPVLLPSCLTLSPYKAVYRLLLYIISIRNWVLVFFFVGKHKTIMMNNQHFARECEEHME